MAETLRRDSIFQGQKKIKISINVSSSKFWFLIFRVVLNFLSYLGIWKCFTIYQNGTKSAARKPSSPQHGKIYQEKINPGWVENLIQKLFLMYHLFYHIRCSVNFEENWVILVLFTLHAVKIIYIYIYTHTHTKWPANLLVSYHKSTFIVAFD